MNQTKNKKHAIDQTQHPLDALVAVMKALRDPDGGCPWDLEQDFKSIAQYTIEEAYEVADAIDRGDMNDLREELGDLLFQSVYHAQMASESQEFDLYDVIQDVTAKMIARHPHVFGNEEARSASDVNEIWDRQKDKEKDKTSILDDVPKNFPALLRAQKLQKRAAKVGFEWPDLLPVLDKLEEEIAELRVAIAKNDVKNQEEELGDMLFVLVNCARMQGFSAEEILRQCCNKFEKRFKGMEDDAKAMGLKGLEAANLDQMTQLWDDQKKK